MRGMARVVMLVVAVLLMAAGLPRMADAPWQRIDLPTDKTLLDVAFTETDPDHGWLVGDKGTLIETRDGGRTWDIKSLLADKDDYYLTSISFKGAEGWIAGEPKLMLHTTDEGANWQQIPLNAQLPGEPMLITALGPNSAELVTNVGAVYVTEDSGRNWSSKVDEAISVLRSINRSDDGSYLSVSARGNFYALLRPENRTWQPFPRDTSRRLQNIGFGPEGRGWRLGRGAEISFTNDLSTGEWDKVQRPGRATSFGYLDVTFQDENNVWVVGGGATLIHSPDGGVTWESVESFDGVPANFYTVTFPQPDRGFILGQRGALLRYGT